MTHEVRLRDITEADFPLFFGFQADPVAARMAAFGTRDSDPTQLAARWKKALADGSMAQKAILGEDGGVIGFVATFLLEGKPQVTYWVARSHWGRGVATAALSQLLRAFPARPLYASAAKDNAGSIRVLEKCRFTVCGSEKAFAAARGEDVDEVFLVLP